MHKKTLARMLAKTLLFNLFSFSCDVIVFAIMLITIDCSSLSVCTYDNMAYQLLFVVLETTVMYCDYSNRQPHAYRQTRYRWSYVILARSGPTPVITHPLT